MTLPEWFRLQVHRGQCDDVHVRHRLNEGLDAQFKNVSSVIGGLSAHCGITSGGNGSTTRFAVQLLYYDKLEQRCGQGAALPQS